MSTVELPHFSVQTSQYGDYAIAYPKDPVRASQSGYAEVWVMDQWSPELQHIAAP